jgi:ATP-dependent Lon protease
MLLPLFPLRMVVFPGELVNLHIFEPRYRQLIGECEETGKFFGIPAFIEDRVMEIGTEMELLEVTNRYPNGELDVKTRARGLFRIEQFFETAPTKLYAGAEVTPLSLDMDGDLLLAKRLVEKLHRLFSQLEVKKEVPEDPAELNTFNFGHHLGLDLEQEYRFLTLPSEFARQEFLDQHLDMLLPRVEKMEALRRKAQMNGHFKNVIPPK